MKITGQLGEELEAPNAKAGSQDAWGLRSTLGKGVGLSGLGWRGLGQDAWVLS